MEKQEQNWEEEFDKEFYKNADYFWISRGAESYGSIQPQMGRAELLRFIRTQKEQSYKEGYEAGKQEENQIIDPRPRTYEEKNIMGKEAMEDRAPFWIEEGKQRERERILGFIEKELMSCEYCKKIVDEDCLHYPLLHNQVLSDLKELIEKSR